MDQPPRHRQRVALPRVARSLVIVTLGLMSACHVWRPATLDPAHEFLNGRTRLHRTDGSAVIVVGPRVVGDSIVGRWPNGTARVALPRADVQSVEVYRVSRGRTAVVGLGLFALYVALQVALANSADTYYDPY